MKLSSSRCRVAQLLCAGRQAPHSPWLGTDVLRGLEVCKLRGRLLNIINNKNKLLLEVWGACGQPEGEGLGRGFPAAGAVRGSPLGVRAAPGILLTAPGVTVLLEERNSRRV